MRYLISLILIIVPELLFAQQSLDTLWVRVIRRLDGTTIKILDTLEFSDGTKIWSRTGLSSSAVDSTNFQKYQDTLTFDFTRTQFNAEILKYVAKSDTATWLPTWHDILAQDYQSLEDVIATLEAERGGWGYMSYVDTVALIATKSYVNSLVIPITYYPSSLTVSPGTLDSGTVVSMSTIDDGRSVLVSEVTGTPGFIIQVTFASAAGLNTIQLHAHYVGNVAHTVQVQLYNVNTTVWDVLGTIPSGATLTSYTFTVSNPNNYLDGSNNALCRITHTSAGNATHDMIIDYWVAKKVPAGGAGGVTEHGALTGLLDNDHPQYVLGADSASWLPTWADILALNYLKATDTTWIGTQYRLWSGLSTGRIPKWDGTRYVNSAMITTSGDSLVWSVADAINNLTWYIGNGGYFRIARNNGEWLEFQTTSSYVTALSRGKEFRVGTNDNFVVSFMQNGGVAGYIATTKDLVWNYPISATYLTLSSYLEVSSYLYTRSHIMLRNKANDNWLYFATRNSAGSETVFDLNNVGTIASTRTNLGVNYTTAPLSNIETAAFEQLQDVLVWMQPDSAQYYNGSAWVTYTSAPDWKSITDNNSTTTVTIDSTHKSFRLYYNMTGRTPSYGKIWRLEQAWTNPSGEKSFGFWVEQADNGGMSTNLESLGGDSITWSTGYGQALIQTTRHNRNYLRVTINVAGMTSSSAQFQPASLCLISARATSQGAINGKGMPFVWDNAKNVTLTGITKQDTDTLATKAYARSAGGSDGQNADSLNGKILDTLGRDLGAGKYTVPAYNPDSTKYKHFQLVGFDSTGLSIGDSTACVLSVQANKIVITRQKNRSGSAAFTTTGQRVAVYIPGAKSTDRYFLQTYIAGTTPPSAVDTRMGVTAKTDSLVVWRPASGTSGQTFYWWRVP